MSKIKIENLSLDDAWKYCMRMYRKVGKRLKEKPNADVSWLKREIKEEMGIDALAGGCFFCEYASQQTKDSSNRCHECPGVLVDPPFGCCRHDIHYLNQPLAFIKELERLYKIYKEQNIGWNKAKEQQHDQTTKII